MGEQNNACCVKAAVAMLAGREAGVHTEAVHTRLIDPAGGRARAIPARFLVVAEDSVRSEEWTSEDDEGAGEDELQIEATLYALTPQEITPLSR
jgi:hypothetical protein